MPVRMFATSAAAQNNLSGGTMVALPAGVLPPQRVYASTPGTPIDVVGDAAGDVATLASLGYIAIAQSGTTTQRPNLGSSTVTTTTAPSTVTTSSLRPGTLYVDTTLSIVVIWDGANWRNVVTGVIA